MGNSTARLWDGLRRIYNTETDKDPFEYERMSGWGGTLEQKATWFLLYANHLDWFPGRWLWRALMPNDLLAMYERSKQSEDGFWYSGGDDG
jgi:hypothetical protein